MTNMDVFTNRWKVEMNVKSSHNEEMCGQISLVVEATDGPSACAKAGFELSKFDVVLVDVVDAKLWPEVAGGSCQWMRDHKGLFVDRVDAPLVKRFLEALHDRRISFGIDITIFVTDGQKWVAHNVAGTPSGRSGLYEATESIAREFWD